MVSNFSDGFSGGQTDFTLFVEVFNSSNGHSKCQSSMNVFYDSNNESQVNFCSLKLELLLLSNHLQEDAIIEDLFEMALSSLFKEENQFNF